MPESIASDVTYKDDLARGFAAPRTKCIICRQKHKPGYIGLYCTDCLHEMNTKNARRTKATSQSDPNLASFKPNKGLFAKLYETASTEGSNASNRSVRIFSDPSKWDKNQYSQFKIKRNTGREKANKRKHKDLSSSRFDGSDSPLLTQDNVDVRFKVCKSEDTWKAKITLDGNNYTNISKAAKAKQILLKKSRSELLTTTADAKTYQSFTLNCKSARKNMIFYLLIIGSRLDNINYYCSVFLFLRLGLRYLLLYTLWRYYFWTDYVVSKTLIL